MLTISLFFVFLYKSKQVSKKYSWLVNTDVRDLSFITVKITDEDGNMIPDADNMITFMVWPGLNFS